VQDLNTILFKTLEGVIDQFNGGDGTGDRQVSIRVGLPQNAKA
jgi:hypothetical protein